MTWFKIQDEILTDDKFYDVGFGAKWAWLMGLAYCSQQMTDGFIPTRAIRLIGSKAELRELVTHGLLAEVEGGWEYPKYLEHQRSKAQILQTRDSGARRAALFRNPELKRQLRERDQDRCRYCGETVNFKDRRSPLRATYDHVNPHLVTNPNTLQNLVVACAACNSKKGRRTPTEARMPLLPPPDQGKPKSNQVSELVTNKIEESREEKNNPPTPQTRKTEWRDAIAEATGKTGRKAKASVKIRETAEWLDARGADPTDVAVFFERWHLTYPDAHPPMDPSKIPAHWDRVMDSSVPNIGDRRATVKPVGVEPDCWACRDTGWVLDETGEAGPCTECVLEVLDP